MFGFDEQMDLLRAWGDMALGCMAAAAQMSTAMLTQSGAPLFPAKPSRAPQQPPCARADDSPINSRPSSCSWYKAPESRPFDAAWLGLTWPFPMAAPSLAFAAPHPLQAWANLFQLTGLPTALTIPISPLNWSNPAVWPTAHLPWMGMNWAALAPSVPAPASTAPPFASYRSASGHAVAQITFPNEVVAAVALPSSAASLLDTFFAWPRVAH